MLLLVPSVDLPSALPSVRRAEEMWWLVVLSGEGMLIRTLSTRLWTVLFILNP